VRWGEGQEQGVVGHSSTRRQQGGQAEEEGRTVGRRSATGGSGAQLDEKTAGGQAEEEGRSVGRRPGTGGNS